MSEDLIARAEAYLALAEKATPGPWAQDDDCHVFSKPLSDARFEAIRRILELPSPTIEDQDNSTLDPSVCNTEQQRPQAAEDMTFIAASHEAASIICSLLASRSEGWQDISTAPKDGTRVFGCIAGYMPTVMHWEHDNWRTLDRDDFPDSDEGEEGWRQALYSDYRPTHWRPLPESPK